MKIQITKPEQKPFEPFNKGQLIESTKGGIYLCTSNQRGSLVDLVVIHPDTGFEYPGKIITDAWEDNFKLFTGEVTLSND